MSPTDDDPMDRLERRANVVRSRLLRTIDALDERRHQVAEIGSKAKRVVPIAGLVALGIAGLAAGSIIALRAYLRGRKARRTFIPRLRIEKKPSMLLQLLQKVVLTAATAIAAEVSRRMTKNALDGRLPDGRLAVTGPLGLHHEQMMKSR